MFFQRKKAPASQPARGRANRRGPYRTLPREAGELSVVFSGPKMQPVRAELVDLSTRGIGVRIEDDALVTAQGSELLSAAAPKSVADIENLMRASRD